ncbi:unnamed protein product [Auanema sp. JU1783]|nr:unnamed protein product [Auanema sp. JU1783]
MFLLFLIFIALPLSLSQFDSFSEFPPPPWHHRPHHHRHHHPFGHWHHPPPWRGFHFPPPEDFLPPPSLPPPPPPPAPISPPPAPPPQPMPSPYTPEMQKVIQSINKKSEHFSKSGENYENVIKVLKDFYKKKTGLQYDFSNFKLPTVTGRSELSANQRTAGIFYENDVVLTLSQARTITKETNRKKRKIVSDLSKRWTRSISFRFQENDEEWKTSIRSAISVFTSSTCLSFIENGPSRDYLIFTKGQGCYSSVGKLGGSQEVSIGFGCDGEGVISHEIAHSLGLWHEQSRPDRNNFVKIFPQNMMSGAQAQFERLNTTITSDYGVPYDYGSAMHYPVFAFVRQSGLTSIEPTDRSFRNTIGSRVSLSFLDVKVINAAYCSNVCQQSLPCQNNGYPHPNACTRCLCPSGFSGKFCENLEYSEFGSELVATSSWKTLRYQGSLQSFWRIRAQGSKIVFEFTSVYFKCSPSCEEFVEVGFSFSRLTIPLIVPEQRAPKIPPQQPKPIRRDPSRWSGWSAWSSCSEACGACGKEERTRTCLSSSCRMNSRQSQARTCNLNPCRSGTTRGRGKRSTLEARVRHKRQTSWCCAGYKKTTTNWCSQV